MCCCDLRISFIWPFRNFYISNLRSLRDSAKKHRSSMFLITLSSNLVEESVITLKMSEALQIPCPRTFILNLPAVVEMTRRSDDSSLIGICEYPDVQSIVAKNLEERNPSLCSSKSWCLLEQDPGPQKTGVPFFPRTVKPARPADDHWISYKVLSP